MRSRNGAQWLALAVRTGASSGSESGDTSLAGFAGERRPHPPGGRTVTFTAFR